MPLPIHQILPTLVDTIPIKDCILSAPPGAGKSTALPLALLDIEAFASKTIILLQPRQVAVRSIANYLSEQIGEAIGQNVGYQMRGESRVSNSTRLCVMTEGVLIAKLQVDPELIDTALIIFDEFHERSVNSDIALALCLEVQSALREDLRILVMSASLNSAELQNLMPKACALSCEGRTYPIEYRYRPYSSHNGLKIALTTVIEEAISKCSGNILVFLPGVSLIKELHRLFFDKKFQGLKCFALFGAMPLAQQKEALAPSHGKYRKLILATNIAETSLTIDDLQVVIDSGREKVLKLNLARKTKQLVEQFISKASTIQRAGRAGRQQAGICYRMWSAEQQSFLVEYPTPSISLVDISQYMLLLIDWGSDFEQLALIDKPSHAQQAFALQLLQSLQLIDKKNKLSTLGKKALHFNSHPRIAKILASADLQKDVTQKLLAALLVSVLEDNKTNKYGALANNYFGLMEELHELLVSIKPSHLLYKDIVRLARKLGLKETQIKLDSLKISLPSLLDSVVIMLMEAYPDKLAKLNNKGNYKLSDGTGAKLNKCASQRSTKHTSHTELNVAPWIICIDLQIQDEANASIWRYQQIPEAIIEDCILINQHKVIEQTWDNKLSKVVQKEDCYLGKILLSSKATPVKLSQKTQQLIYAEIYDKGLPKILSMFHKKALQLMYRIRFAHTSDLDFLPEGLALLAKSIDVLLDEASIKDEYIDLLEDYLNLYMSEVTTWKQVLALDWYGVLSAKLTWQQQEYLDKYFPSHFVSPIGSRYAINYQNKTQVELSIKMQELYGMSEGPSIGKSKFKLTISLLSPANRELQKTTDLKVFWKGSYQEVQKEMKSRYPKHYWPDNPESAKPTNKTKNKM